MKDEKVFLLAVKTPAIKWKVDVYEFKNKKMRDKAIKGLKVKKVKAQAEFVTAEGTR